MYHEAVQYMHDTGRDVFDFQGGRPGVFKFKKGFSPERGEFYISKQIHIPGVYEEMVDAASAAGIDTETGYFPAYRIEQSN
jgi:lipid II:glycine glycyltransferase (peptidoglycan interpeptide bridge formation enzyme)